MAIERAAAMDAPEPSEATKPESGDSGETETLSMSLLGGKTVQPGDVVRLEVVSVDEDNGTWEGKYAQSKPMHGKAIDRAAAEYDQMPGMNKMGA